MMTVADYIARFLVSKNVQHIFGFQGSAMLKILDAIMTTGKIKYIQNFNEQASAFAADAYARLRGDIGVAIATSGPGATNLISGIANAYFDSVPAFFITGQDYLINVAQRKSARQNGFQDVDIVNMVRPITKYAVMVEDPQQIAYEMEKAYYLATTGRKGSVLVDIPIDVQFKEVNESELRHFQPCVVVSEEDLKLDMVVEALQSAKRPVILAGGGIVSSGATEEFDMFVKKTKLPVVSTLNGIDAFDNIVGFSGLYGNSEANLAIKNADLILALGVRFASQHIGKKKETYSNCSMVIRVEIDKNEISRTFMAEDITVCSDLKRFLTQLGVKNFSLNINEWLDRIEFWKQKYFNTVICEGNGISPVEFIRHVMSYLQDNAVVTSDVGANQMWVAQALRLKGQQRLLNSSGFGAMGYSLPAAIGASYCTRSSVAAFMGDGGLQMNLQELNMLSLHKNNIKCFVFNNNNLGLMRDIQIRYYSSHFWGNNEQEFCCPDLKKLAETFDLNFARISTNDDFCKLNMIFADDKPWLVEVCLDKNCKVRNRYDDKALIDG